MAFDPNAINKRFLINVALDGYTVRWARVGDEDLHMEDDTYYDGKVVSISSLSRSAGALLDPRIVLPSMTLIVDNKKDQAGVRVQDLFDTYTWGNRVVTILIGQGNDLTDFDTLWEGVVQFPNGIHITDSQVTIQLNDLRKKDAVVLPNTTITLAAYPHAAASSIGLPKPILYGDWYTTAGNGEQVPCLLIDSTVGTGGKWMIAGHGIKSIERVLKNGASVSFTGDLDNGQFTLNVVYSAGTDVITCNCRGATDTGLSSGTLLQTMPAVFNDILQTRCGISAANIDSAALTAWAAELTSLDYVRRYINAEVDSHEVLIAELLREGFADLSIEASKYFPRYRRISATGTLPQYEAQDLAFSTGEDRDFAIARDPEQVYCNEGYGWFAYNPVAGDYSTRTELAENLGAIADDGTRVRRTIYFNWMYNATGVGDRIQREVAVFSNLIELVNIKVSARAVTEGPADQFRLIYNKFVEVDTDLGTPFQIRACEVDLWTFTSRISQAWNLLTLGGGTWTEDDIITWLLATIGQRNVKGFFTDDSGYADTSGSPDAASRRYKWV